MSGFERIGTTLGAAFYAVQAVALGGGLLAFVAGGRAAGNAWLRWTLPPAIAVAFALIVGLPAWGAATALWEVFREG